MISDFRYWLSRDERTAVSIVFDDAHRGHMFDIDMAGATKNYPDDSVEMVIYKISVARFRADSIC